MLNKILFTLYPLVILAMAASTVVEKYCGTEFVSTYFYGSWWFSLLWALLAAAAIAYIIISHLRRWNILLLHISLIIILAGALLTHLTSFKGGIHLRVGETSDEYYKTDNNMSDMKKEHLPFKLRLDAFNIQYHDGTDAANNYMSHITVINGNEHFTGIISMNKIFSYKGIRFYQSSYDEDCHGSILQINSDPYGIPVTYTGYVILFFSLIWLLIDPKGTFRRLLRSDALRKGAFILPLLLCALSSSATTTLPMKTAGHLGQLYMLHNDRVCQMQTYAYDFTKKLCGRATYKGCTPEQVMAGFIFWGNDWCNEPIIKVKGGELKETLHLPDYISLNSLFPMGQYNLQVYVEEYYNGNQDKINSEAAKLDEKVQLIMELRSGSPFKIFPKTIKDQTKWFAPNQKYPSYISHTDSVRMQQVFANLYTSAISGNNARVNNIIDKVIQYQFSNGGNSLPSKIQVSAERLNNAVPFATILFMVNLTLGFIALLYTIWHMTVGRNLHLINISLSILLMISFMALTLTLSLRWIISGYIPMSNGYESMLMIAWFTQFIAILMQRKAHIVLVFGFLLSGFFLLVSHISQMDPAIGQIMPVLNSPLLCIHVSIIMMSYALLAFTFICGIMGLCIRSRALQLQTLSRIFLYPAIVTMGIGIFVGAIWANVSWGTYWSWDPKETWALITFMIYSVVLHKQTLPRISRPTVYHLYMTIAFLSIIMTYFGVNYILGGMHSYA